MPNGGRLCYTFCVKKLFSTLCAAIAVVACLTGCAAAGYTVFEPVAVFADDIAFSARIVGGRAQYVYERMKGEIAEIDAQVSPSRADSDVSAFNAAAVGVDVEVGKHCYDMVLLGKRYYELTGGAFNIAAASLSELWHVDTAGIASLRPEAGSKPVSIDLPEPKRVAEALQYCDPTLIEAAEHDGKYYLKKTDGRVKLDLGGIAKGYAVDRCVDVLREYDVRSALIDISGNAYFYGDRIDDGRTKSWNVGIVSPRPRGGETVARGYIAAFSVGGGAAAATSGDYMRYYVCDNGGALYVPHIIGADGIPVGVEYSDGRWRNGAEWVISATAIADSAAASDALSTAVCALGMEDGARLLQKVGCKGLIFTEKRFTIIGGAQLYKPDVYDGYRDYERVDLDIDTERGAA